MINVVACDPLQFSTMLYGAQQPHTVLPYPDGVASWVADNVIPATTPA